MREEGVRPGLRRWCAGIICTLIVAELGAIIGVELGTIWLSATLAGTLVSSVVP